MTILHLTTFLQGGAGRVIAALAATQHRAGHRVIVVTSRTGAVGYGNYRAHVDELTRAGVVVHLVDSMFKREHAANLAVVRLLDRLFARGDEPDVIHAHAAVPSLVALTFAGSRMRPIAILQTMHGWGVQKTPDQVSADITLLNLVHRVVVPSNHASRQLAELGVSRTRISVVPYGIGDDACDIDARDRNLICEMAAAQCAGTLVLACIGTIGARKNQRLIVDALPMRERTPNVLCVFVGDGDASDLRAAMDMAGVGDLCRIHGYSAAARSIAAAADVLVLPSRSEGQPVSVLEAFADGVLVAVSNICELTELVEDNVTGVVFRVDDAGSLADALSRIARMPPAERNAMRTRTQRVHASTFTVRAMTERYAEIYSDVAERSRTFHAGPNMTGLKRVRPLRPARC